MQPNSDKMRARDVVPTTASLLCSIFLFLHLPASTSAAEVTNGPLAPVTIASDVAWSTARACAAGCLEFNGIWVCGVNAGYNGLGLELGCGCASINGCYCNTGLASSASAFLSSCVSAGCGKSVDDWVVDLTSMYGLYDTYCSTANAAEAQTTTTATTTAKTDGAGATGSTTGRTQSNSGASQTSASGSGATASSGPQSKPDGLSQSDIVALAASLGVGIPSLLIAAVTLWVQLRKKRRLAAEAQTSTTQKIHDTPQSQPQPQPQPQGPVVFHPGHIQELSGSGSNRWHY